jgi:Cd2+/Zn2+-exporting ATPase
MKFIKKHLFAFRFITSLILLLTSLIIEKTLPDYEFTIALPLTLVGYAIMTYDLFIKGFKSIIHKDFFDEVTLTIIASIASMAIGEFIDGLAVVMFFQLGEFFEDYALDNSRKSIKAILALRPEFVRLIKNGKEVKCNPDKAKIGDIFIVKPGEIVPIDGIVIEGESSLNTSSITGESLPREVKKDDQILSGVINLNSPIKIRSTKLYQESTVSKILEMVENESSKKTTSEKFITKFAKIYTPIVISGAFLIAIIPPLFFVFKDGNWGTWSEWIYRGASMLVIACPCAIVISIPMAYVVSIGVASKHKTLIKGSTYIELMNKAKNIYLDKTGTITAGKFNVYSINPAKGIKEEDLLKIAQIGESNSNHPIAKAIVNGLDLSNEQKDLKKYVELNGKGIKAEYLGKSLLLGNASLLKDNQIEFKETKDVGTIIYVAYDKKYLGHLVIRDVIKPDAIEAINLFKKEGITNITMLTGDNPDIAKEIAEKAGITNYKAGLLPIDKTKVLDAAKLNHEVTIFVGDGVNDAPSLVKSDIGISMGGIGSDSAIEASDIVIMDDDLRRIAFLKSLAKLNKFVVNWNLYFAIIIKITTLILNSLGLLGKYAIIAAIFADVGVTIICCINSLMINFKKK